MFYNEPLYWFGFATAIVLSIAGIIIGLWLMEFRGKE